MSIFIDRRLTDRNKSLNNRKKYLDRVKDQLKDSIKKTIASSNIKDLLSSKNKTVTIPGKGLAKPQFFFKKGGIADRVHPGNKRFDKGDTFRRPNEDDDDGDSEDGGLGEDGEDPFTFTLTKDEFLDLFFEDLELPDMIKKQLTEIKDDVPQRAGFSVDGAPNRLNILRSMKQSKGRRFALMQPLEKAIERLILEKTKIQNTEDITYENVKKRLAEIDHELAILEAKIKAIPFFDDIDLRYNRWEIKPRPITQAVMFIVLDVSGSMGEWEKEMAKRFFFFEALFLQSNYERIAIEWIIHTTHAFRVSEEEFFETRLNGGTVVSSALELVSDIIKKEYNPSQWNIFISQISDGDNSLADNPKTIHLLETDILPVTQYYTYVEIRKGENALLATLMGNGSSLFSAFSILDQKFKNFKRSIINDVTNIYPVFRKLFEKKK